MLTYELRVSVTMIGIKDEMHVKAPAMLRTIRDIAVENKINLSQRTQVSKYSQALQIEKSAYARFLRV